MANSFVKWWRAKFLNGYRHINVVGGEEGCGRSDTETLVRACEDDLAPTPPPRAPPTLAPGTYVEEVSCDVSVAAGEADRQEFSFTLYDFDGHGKVTKDDIAGLVRTIYEAVGSSLSLPHSGSRTIRVKLTVAPENGRGRQHQDSPQQTPQQQQQQQEWCEGKKGEEEVEGCEGRGQRRRRGRRRSTSLQRHELLQIIQANMEKNNLFYTPLHRRHDHHHHDHRHRRRRRHPCSCDHAGSPPDPAEVKARLMEPECWCRHTHYHSHNHGPVTPGRPAAGGCGRRHNRSHSHDLSRDSPHVFRYHLLDKTFQPLPPSNTPDQPPSPPVVHTHHQHHHQPRQHQHHHHHRSRSFDGADTQGSSPRGRAGRSSRVQQQVQSQVGKQPKEQLPPLEQQQQQQQPPSQQVSPSKEAQQGSKEVSPHHTKHRQREAEHARAMAQVVAWLERGSLLDSSPRSPTSPESGGGLGGACRDQTNHVHQHIHHHYHHYAEKQPPPLLI